MTPDEFCRWLQGFAELNGDAQPTDAQWKSIKEHLQTVFTKVTPTIDSATKTDLKNAIDAVRYSPPGRIC